MGKLEILSDNEVLISAPLSHRTIRVGRGFDNDLVIDEATVSTQHINVYYRDGAVWVRDLGSTNGTYINEILCREAVAVTRADEVRLGPRTRLRVAVSGTIEPFQAVVGDLSRNRRGLIPAEGCLLGDAIVDSPADVAGIRVDPVPGGVRLGGNIPIEVIRFGDTFEAHGSAFSVDDYERVTAGTQHTQEGMRWHLLIDMSGRPGPSAQLTCPGVLEAHVIRAANRIAVLYILGKQLLEDVDMTEATAGWVSDDTLMRGVWGRKWEEKGSASFQVLIHRVRRDLERAGMDANSIEKQAGFTRFKPGILEFQEVDGSN